MHRRSACAGLVLASLFAPSFSHAAERATPEEAKALAQKAAAHLVQVGPQKAIADFMDPAAGFVDRELFVIVYGPDNKILCGYGVPVLTGKDATTLRTSRAANSARTSSRLPSPRVPAGSTIA